MRIIFFEQILQTILSKDKELNMIGLFNNCSAMYFFF